MRNDFSKIALIISLFFVQAGHAQVSKKQYISEQKRHVQRVCSAMVMAHEAFEGRFKYLDRSVIEIFCAAHDAPKWMTLEELKHYDYKFDEDIAEIMSRYHGVEFSELPDEERAFPISVIKELNRIESEIKKEIYHGVDHPVYSDRWLFEAHSEFTQLEVWVDYFDVKMFREDIGKDGGPGEAVKALRRAGHLTDLGRDIVEFLEDYYVRMDHRSCSEYFLENGQNLPKH